MTTQRRALSLAIVISSTFAVMACSPSKHSSVQTKAPESKSSPQPNSDTSAKSTAAAKVIERADRAKLYSAASQAIANLRIPYGVALDKSPAPTGKEIRLFKTIRCELLLRRFAKAPKSETNLYDGDLFKDLCSNRGGHLEIVPGQSLSNQNFHAHVFGEESMSAEVTFRKDNTVSGYRIMRKEPGAPSDLASGVIQKGVVVKSTKDDLTTIVDVHALDGSYDFNSQQTSQHYFHGSSSAQTLVFRKFAGDSVLTVSDSVSISSVNGKKTESCHVLVTTKNGESLSETFHDQTCFK